MELLVTDQHFIVVDGEHTLWISRHSQAVEAKTGSENDISGATCLGTVHGYLGKINFGSGCDTRLIFIRQKAFIGLLDGCEIYKILSVVSVPLETDVELILEACTTHSTPTGDPNVRSTIPLQDSSSSHIHPPSSIEYTGQRNLFKVKTGSAGTAAATDRISPLLRRNERIDKVERKIIDEFHKMFTDADSFYYSIKYDLTNTVQRQYFISEKKLDPTCSIAPLQFADQRFIWNFHMINDLIQSEDARLHRWIIPLIHGFIEHSKCELDLHDGPPPTGVEPRDHIDLWLISRRSRFRAGTRYLRRGIDEDGNVANYVETEQIMIFQHHKTSFVQIRGSIPLYWSQSSQRYRPTPRLDRSEEESFVALQKHFQEERSLYGPIIIVNLIDKTGREKILGDAYLSNVLTYNSPDITYLSFDFHEHCRGMHFENVSIVINKLEDAFNRTSYCWVDSYGIVLQQNGVLRVNCVDCLDRTNLTQTQFGRHVLETQLSKLGLLAPEIGLAKNIKVKLQAMWANNGDTISKQYAGTNALKGDFTRTGERKFTSALKDGMNSANRFYLNRFRDIHRQAAIDITMGERKTLTEDDLDDGKGGEEKETIEQIRIIIEDVKKCVVPANAIVRGAWCFVNAKRNVPGMIDIDTIFVLTEEFCFTTEYDCTLDSITETEAVHLNALTEMELGFAKPPQTNFLSFVGHSVNYTAINTTVPCLRISYKQDDEVRCHEFLSSNIQFTNDAALHLQLPEEMLESVKAVATCIQSATENLGNPIKLHEFKMLPDRSDISKHSASSNSNSNLESPIEILAQSLPPPLQPTQIRRSSEVVVPKDLKEKDEAQLTRVLSLKHPKQINNPHFEASVRRPLQALAATAKSRMGDLVLPSCGVITVSLSSEIPSYCRTRPTQLNSTINCIPTAKSNFEISNEMKAPIVETPIEASGTVHPENESPEELLKPDQNIMSRHRMSLPVSSAIPSDFGVRSVTPEIKITEVPQNLPVDDAGAKNARLGIPTLTKRMSRSTEEISSDLETNEPQQESSGNSKLNPAFSKDNRSSSIQNIFSSALNMKSSRSENTILARASSARITSINPLSKESVLAPLGKLARGMQKSANYFDPRKLKGTFKPAAKNLQEEVQRKEDKEYLLAIENKKKNCKSIIIEI